MSTHSLDVSGARPLTSTVNDPARTAAQVPAKAGDDVSVTLSGVREIRINLGDGVGRIQRRRYESRSIVYEDGKPKKDEAGEYVYQTTQSEMIVLVLPGNITAFGRASVLEGEENPPSYEGTSHTQVSARRQAEPHFNESGELIEEVALADLLAKGDS